MTEEVPDSWKAWHGPQAEVGRHIEQQRKCDCQYETDLMGGKEVAAGPQEDGTGTASFGPQLPLPALISSRFESSGGLVISRCHGDRGLVTADEISGALERVGGSCRLSSLVPSHLSLTLAFTQ